MASNSAPDARTLGRAITSSLRISTAGAAPDPPHKPAALAPIDPSRTPLASPRGSTASCTMLAAPQPPGTPSPFSAGAQPPSRQSTSGMLAMPAGTGSPRQSQSQGGALLSRASSFRHSSSGMAPTAAGGTGAGAGAMGGAGSSARGRLSYTGGGGGLLGACADPAPPGRASASELPRLAFGPPDSPLDSSSRPGALRRSMTGIARHNVPLDAKDSPSHSPVRGQGHGQGLESSFALKKERMTLQQDKAALLLMKRRLEALLTKALEGPLADLEDDDGAAFAWEGSGASLLAGTPVGAAGKGSVGLLKSQLRKALDNSATLERQLGSGGAGMALAAADAEAQIQELHAQIAEMKLDHEVALSRMEGDMSYRRTQAAAAAAGLQRQAAEATAEAGRLQSALAASERAVRELTAQSSGLRTQLHELSAALAAKTQQVADTRELMGMDKATMDTVIEMLKTQLRDANAEREAQAQRIQELESAVVHRDGLLAEAEDRINRAAVAAAAASAAGCSPLAVAAAVRAAA
ncbi:hypothetical protein HYH03_017064 [Edaphochlamys debaryana]|uniref:Uncharacterized protein n=1 Tax=Edaphochlamys debaryana TaxID=47281 RepID=A0A835XHD3_9CHLO|nr:hypothetical protein HYH03_017064 [Edaphochlamys debaryana]|eukprot:KAG2484113.1 hypothetical protein HYH03_017064 [Edaphochlamys debaryana]